MLKLVYAMSRRQFGKVMTPIKVFVARMPLGVWYVYRARSAKLDKKLELPVETQMLVRERVAHINVCEFCIDIGRSFAIKAGMNEAKFDALEDYATSPLFNEAERAALDYVTELDARQEREAGDFRAAQEALFRAGHLRDCVAGGERACVQHDEYRAEHSFGHAVRHSEEEVGT